MKDDLENIKSNKGATELLSALDNLCLVLAKEVNHISNGDIGLCSLIGVENTKDVLKDCLSLIDKSPKLRELVKDAMKAESATEAPKEAKMVNIQDMVLGKG